MGFRSCRFVAVFVCLCIFTTTLEAAPWTWDSGCFWLEFVSRDDWGARDHDEVKEVKKNMATPVPEVVVHHTGTDTQCTAHTSTTCAQRVNNIQYFHMYDRSTGWGDIGYNFLIGGDGKIYIGRGWDTVGAHAKYYNDKSVGIAIIGDYTSTLPPSHILTVLEDLLACGVHSGFLQWNYRLRTHRDVKQETENVYTECPGNSLYDEITYWWHYE